MFIIYDDLVFNTQGKSRLLSYSCVNKCYQKNLVLFNGIWAHRIHQSKRTNL